MVTASDLDLVVCGEWMCRFALHCSCMRMRSRATTTAPITLSLGDA